MKKNVNRFVYLFICLFVYLLAASFVFAQQQEKSLGIKSADVDGYIKNYSSINKEINALGYNEKGMQREPTKEELQKRDEILKKYGITGSNAFEKMERITQYSQQLDYASGQKLKPEEKEVMRNMMNPSDLKAIEPKYKDVLSAYNKYNGPAGSLFNFDIKDKLNLPFEFKKKKKD